MRMEMAASLVSPGPPRRALGLISGNKMVLSPGTPMSAKSVNTPMSKKAPTNKTKPPIVASPKPAVPAAPVVAAPVIASPKPEHAIVFGRPGVLETTRGPTPPDATAFGVEGLLEADRGNTPLAYKSEGREAALELEQVHAFLAARTDGTLCAGRVFCSTTRHEMVPVLSVIEAHWAGKKYRRAAMAAAASPAPARKVKRVKQMAILQMEDPNMEDLGAPARLPCLPACPRTRVRSAQRHPPIPPLQ